MADPAFTIHDGPPPLWQASDDWAEGALPKRAWLAYKFLMRGAVTVVSGAGGSSKSSLMISWAVAAALGRPFSGFEPINALTVLVYNVEDDDQEQQRRFSAALRGFGQMPAALQGKVIRSGPGGVGTLLERTDTGQIRATAAMAALEQAIRDTKPDVVILDPLVELHNCDENDNGALRAVMAFFRALAVRHGIAVVLVHHARKGASQATPGDTDTLRGASSIVGAARIVLTVNGMSEQEAAGFGLKPDDRRHYFRVDCGKSNYSPLDTAEWFERQAILLDNEDVVAVPRPWTPPQDKPGLEQRDAIKAGIEAGSPLGPWSAKLSGDARSVRRLFEQHGITTAAGQRAMNDELRAEGYVVANFRASKSQIRQGLRAPNGAPFSVQWSDDAQS